MLRLPARFTALILCLAPLFQQRSWRHARVLLVGAILAPGRRTVTSILRVTRLCRERRFVNYHCILVSLAHLHLLAIGWRVRWRRGGRFALGRGSP